MIKCTIPYIINSIAIPPITAITFLPFVHSIFIPPITVLLFVLSRVNEIFFKQIGFITLHMINPIYFISYLFVNYFNNSLSIALIIGFWLLSHNINLYVSPFTICGFDNGIIIFPSLSALYGIIETTFRD